MSLKSLQNSVAIVTGGTRGIGRAIAGALLKEGAKVAVCGTTRQSVDDAVAGLSKVGEVLGMVADISRPDKVKQFVAAVIHQFKSVHILVNNAGVATFRAVADLSPEEWERMIGINLSGVYYCSHEVLPIFKRQGGGDIVNIGSLAGKNPFAGGAGYNASKYGLNGFTEAMMLDHRYDGVRVSSVMPGSVATSFGRDATGFGRDATGFGGGSEDSGADWKIAPEDIADVVVSILKMPARTTVSRVEIRPSRPVRKT